MRESREINLPQRRAQEVLLNWPHKNRQTVLELMPEIKKIHCHASVGRGSRILTFSRDCRVQNSFSLSNQPILYHYLSRWQSLSSIRTHSGRRRSISVLHLRQTSAVRRSENGLNVPGYNQPTAIAGKFEEEILRLKVFCSHMEIKAETVRGGGRSDLLKCGNDVVN